MRRRLILVSVLLYISLFLYFYPPFYTTLDEANYIRGSFTLREGSVGIDDPMHRYGFIFNGQKYVPIAYGMPLLLVPFTVLGWKSAFLAGLLFHLASVFLFYKLLLRLGEKPENVLLYLFFPYLLYYSTTLYPDFYAAFFTLAGFYLYLSKRNSHHVLSGLLFGAAVVLKYTNFLVFLPFALVSLVRDREKLVYLLLGLVPMGLLIFLLNHAYYGGVFKTGYGLVLVDDPLRQESLETLIPVKRWSLENYASYLPFISFRLLIIYPLMLLAPFFYRGKGREEIILAVLIFLFFFGSRTQTGWGFNLDPSTLTRYFLPIMPLFILTYVPFYRRVLKKLNIPRNAALYAAALLLIIGGVFILSVQKERLEIQRAVSEEIYASTEPGALLIGEFDVIRYLLEPFGDRRFLLSVTPNITAYFDDKTYIVHKRLENPGPIEEEQNRIIEDLIARSDAELIKKVRYTTETRVFASRPFTLEIYRVTAPDGGG